MLIFDPVPRIAFFGSWYLLIPDAEIGPLLACACESRDYPLMTIRVFTRVDIDFIFPQAFSVIWWFLTGLILPQFSWHSAAILDISTPKAGNLLGSWPTQVSVRGQLVHHLKCQISTCSSAPGTGPWVSSVTVSNRPPCVPRVLQPWARRIPVLPQIDFPVCLGYYILGQEEPQFHLSSRLPCVPRELFLGQVEYQFYLGNRSLGEFTPFGQDKSLVYLGNYFLG